MLGGGRGTDLTWTAEKVCQGGTAGGAGRVRLEAMRGPGVGRTPRWPEGVRPCPRVGKASAVSAALASRGRGEGQAGAGWRRAAAHRAALADGASPACKGRNASAGQKQCWRGGAWAVPGAFRGRHRQARRIRGSERVKERPHRAPPTAAGRRALAAGPGARLACQCVHACAVAAPAPRPLNASGGPGSAGGGECGAAGGGARRGAAGSRGAASSANCMISLRDVGLQVCLEVV